MQPDANRGKVATHSAKCTNMYHAPPALQLPSYTISPAADMQWGSKLQSLNRDQPTFIHNAGAGTTLCRPRNGCKKIMLKHAANWPAGACTPTHSSPCYDKIDSRSHLSLPWLCDDRQIAAAYPKTHALPAAYIHT